MRRRTDKRRQQKHGEFIIGGICLKGIQEEDHRKLANERERERMKQLSQAFEALKRSVPWVPSDTKLSKADILRIAALYIQYLTHLSRGDEVAAEHTATLAVKKWPWQRTAYLTNGGYNQELKD